MKLLRFFGYVIFYVFVVPIYLVFSAIFIFFGGRLSGRWPGQGHGEIKP